MFVHRCWSVDVTAVYLTSDLWPPLYRAACQRVGQGWREVYDPRRLCAEVPWIAHTDPPQPQNGSAHRWSGRYY